MSSLSPADISGVTVALTMNARAGLNYPTGLNATQAVTGTATMQEA